MLTYDLSKKEGILYRKLYEYIREDIRTGKLNENEKLPSKRSLARNLGISTVTVEKAYEQLMDEGYLYALPKKGYYVARVSGMQKKRKSAGGKKIAGPAQDDRVRFDFSSRKMETDGFPFSVWAKLMREVISGREKDLMTLSPCNGVRELRAAIAGHLSSFRGLSVDPDQIVVGAGTEYLYSLLIRLLGRETPFCLENPGYSKLARIYRVSNVPISLADMDEEGVRLDEIRRTGARVVHTSPAHHFPTGITMSMDRRRELLAWADEEEGRYIIEDDYDSEFRNKGRPVPPLLMLDDREKVIYMNTFSQSLAATIRISYMVLPESLAASYYRDLSFYACTVSTFEQYTLAAFIERGYFEKHINRMRLHYGRKREKIIETIRRELPRDRCRILENEAGLHFLLQLETGLSDREVVSRLADRGIRIRAVTDYYMDDSGKDRHRFMVSYAGMDPDALAGAVREVREILFT